MIFSLNLVPLESVLDATSVVVHAIQVYMVQNQEPGKLDQHTGSLPAAQ